MRVGLFLSSSLGTISPLLGDLAQPRYEGLCLGLLHHVMQGWITLGSLLFSEGKWGNNALRERVRGVGGTGRSEEKGGCGPDVLYERRTNKKRKKFYYFYFFNKMHRLKNF